MKFIGLIAILFAFFSSSVFSNEREFEQFNPQQGEPINLQFSDKPYGETQLLLAENNIRSPHKKEIDATSAAGERQTTIIDENGNLKILNNERPEEQPKEQEDAASSVKPTQEPNAQGPAPREEQAPTLPSITAPPSVSTPPPTGILPSPSATMPMEPPPRYPSSDEPSRTIQQPIQPEMRSPTQTPETIPGRPEPMAQPGMQPMPIRPEPIQQPGMMPAPNRPELQPPRILPNQPPQPGAPANLPTEQNQTAQPFAPPPARQDLRGVPAKPIINPADQQNQTIRPLPNPPIVGPVNPPPGYVPPPSTVSPTQITPPSSTYP